MKWLGAAIVFPSAAFAAPPLPDSDEAAYPAIRRLVEVLESARELHPDTSRLAYERLVNHALEGMMESLDPFSSFIHPEMAQAMKEDSELNPEIASLGFSLGLRDTGPYVMAVAPFGPAASAGLTAGASVLEIDGRATDGGALKDLLETMHRQAGETTKMKVKAPEDIQPREVSLVHRFIEQRSVAETSMFNKEKGVGYVRLGTFGDGCAKEMEASLDDLEDQGMKSLVLDLRGNGGGSLGETVKILGLFVAPSTTVVTTRGRSAKEEVLKTPDRQRRKRDYPVVVLVDRMSASASELTAGALQDLKRAKIIGEKSFGKGSVQNIIPLGGGTALRLTVATYHTPSGKTPHKVGVTPDVVLEFSDADRANFEKKCRIDSLGAEDKKAVEAWADPVMGKAVEMLSGK